VATATSSSSFGTINSPWVSPIVIPCRKGFGLHFNAVLAMLNLLRAEALHIYTDLSLHVFSMAGWKQRHFNDRLLEGFIKNLALDPLWAKNHPSYEKLRTYGAIAA